MAASAPGRGPRPAGRRRTVLAAVLALVAASTVWLVAAADPLPLGLGPCVGSECPDPYPPVGNPPLAGRDEGVNTFVGGDYLVTGSAAESEGRVVVGGSFTVAKTAGSSTYNLGVVGVGSQVPPPPGSDHLVTGGDVAVSPGQSLLVDTGVVRHAGALTGTVTGTDAPDPDAFTPYADWAGELSDASRCYASVEGSPRPPTGTVVNEGSRTLFTGDGASALQVFTVDSDLTGPGGAAQALEFVGIPAGATVLVNVVGDARVIRTYSGDLADDDPWNALRTRMLWNVPDASSLVLSGPAQLQGSFLVGNPASTTTLDAPGLNGRLFTTGSLVHTSSLLGGAGNEIHAYPFDGDLPACIEPTPTPSTPTDTPTSPTPTVPTDTPTSPDPTPTTPTETPTGPSATPTPPGSSTPPTPPTTAAPTEPPEPPGDPGGLAATGADLGRMLAVGGVLLGLGSVLVLARPRPRRH
jgi:choice-of-anchor A domain-containing protein